MKNYLCFVVLTGFVVITSAWQHLENEHVNSAQIFQARQCLLENFASLNLAAILEQNPDYFENLAAGYDFDNQCYFIEQPGTYYRDETILIQISYPRPGEAEVCIYAPEKLCWQWLRSRVRNVGNDINAPIVFIPMQYPDDLLFYQQPAPEKTALSLQANRCHSSGKEYTANLALTPETANLID